MNTSVPDRGDVIWVDFDPALGHEQQGRRPAVVLTRRAYNDQTGMAIVAAVTSKSKGYKFEVPLPSGCGVTGVVLCDQIRMIDLSYRNVSRMSRLPNPVIDAVLRTTRFLLS